MWFSLSWENCLMGSDRDDKAFDVLDMVISFLREHEKTLDQLIYRVEEALSERGLPPEALREPRARAQGISVLMRKWTDFRRRCSGARIVGFVTDDIFKVTALAEGVLHVYVEDIPTIDIRYGGEDKEKKIAGIEADKVVFILKALRGKLDCGLGLEVREFEAGLVEGEMVRRIVCEVDPGAAREWLATELGVESSSIIEGELKLRGID